jgi:uncharacterized protein
MIESQRLKSITNALKRRPEIVLAYLFGSHAKNTARPNSDIDIAVLVDESMVVGNLFEFQTELVAELRDDRVDLVILNHAPPLLQHQVIKHGIKLFTKDKAKAVDFVFKANTRYLDTIYLRRVQDEIMHRHIKEGQYGRIKRSHQRTVEETQRLFGESSNNSGDDEPPTVPK